MSDLIERKSIRNLYSCLNPNDRVLVGQVLIDIDAIPSADVPTTMTGVVDAIREAEYRGYMKAVEERPKEEWTSVLSELHEQFSNLEKEIRRTSAEMSAIIREYVDRPKGEWIDAEIPLESGDTMPIQVCNLCKTFYPLAYTGGGHRFCPNCGADMREREGE